MGYALIWALFAVSKAKLKPKLDIFCGFIGKTFTLLHTHNPCVKAFSYTGKICFRCTLQTFFAVLR